MIMEIRPVPQDFFWMCGLKFKFTVQEVNIYCIYSKYTKQIGSGTYSMQKIIKRFWPEFMISGFFPDHRVSILFVVSSSVHLEFSGHVTKSKQGHALLFGEVLTSTRIYS